MSTITTTEDVEAALMRELDDEERPWVPAALEYLEALIQVRMPQALERARTDAARRTVLARTVAEAVARVLRAPAGGALKSESEGNYTYAVNTLVADGRLALRAPDWEALNGFPPGWGAAGFTGLDGYARARYPEAFQDR